jgi:hypothetical protein
MPVGGAVQDVGSRRSATRIPEPEAGVTVNLQNPQPVIASVSPNPANPGSATIMIDGTGFAKGATVYFAGAALAISSAIVAQQQANYAVPPQAFTAVSIFANG